MKQETRRDYITIRFRFRSIMAFFNPKSLLNLANKITSFSLAQALARQPLIKYRLCPRVGSLNSTSVRARCLWSSAKAPVFQQAGGFVPNSSSSSPMATKLKFPGRYKYKQCPSKNSYMQSAFPMSLLISFHLRKYRF